jgi:hypothetical protein
MGWVPVFRFVMIQCILMTAIINILLNLLGMMTVYGRLLQIIDYILQVFVYSRFGFSQLSSLLQNQAIVSFGIVTTGRIHECAVYNREPVPESVLYAHPSSVHPVPHQSAVR